VTVLLLNRRVSGRTKPPHPSRAIDCVYSGSLRLSASLRGLLWLSPRGFGTGIFTGSSDMEASTHFRNSFRHPTTCMRRAHAVPQSLTSSSNLMHAHCHCLDQKTSDELAVVRGRWPCFLNILANKTHVARCPLAATTATVSLLLWRVPSILEHV
jgi:hypothetical protein